MNILILIATIWIVVAIVKKAKRRRRAARPTRNDVVQIVDAAQNDIIRAKIIKAEQRKLEKLKREDAKQAERDRLQRFREMQARRDLDALEQMRRDILKCSWVAQDELNAADKPRKAEAAQKRIISYDKTLRNIDRQIERAEYTLGRESVA